jgi:hypothetical protein
MMLTRAGLVLLVLVAACGGGASAIDARPDVNDGAVDGPADDAAPVAGRLLFVGNSYVYTHDVPGQVRALVGATTEQVTPGGYTLAQHAEDAATPGTALAGWLGDDGPRWDAVILQEQSQLGGYPLGLNYLDDRLASLDAALALGQRAAARGATVILYQTWGRAHGDPTEPMLYGTYTSMQTHLDAGYERMAELLRARGVAVRLAPVGAAFRHVHDGVVAAGGEPTAADSPFLALYDPDGSHPSPRGAYLAACVLAATATGADPRGFADAPALGPTVSASLRASCAAATADARWRGFTHAVEEAPAYVAPRGEQAVWTRYDVATSDDGARVLIAPSRGEARVLRRDGEAWSTEAVLPLPATAAIRALTLSADGAVALLGAPETGVVYAFARDATGWHAEGELTATDAAGLGRSVALSADGATALVAADGRVHGFTRGGGGWSPSGTLAVERAVVALDGTGARAAIADDTRRAIWRRDGATWREEATLMGGGARAVAIDRAGARAVALGSSGASATVSTARRDADGWHDDGDLPAVPDASSTSPSLALAADGTRVVIATPTRAAPLGQGAAWSFVRGAAGWQLEALIVQGRRADDLQAHGFGTACALADGPVVCTEHGWTAVAWKPGAVRVFRLPP